MSDFRLRPDQEHVAAYRKGYMAVPAVPGAGKTTVLAYLAADLIAQGLPEPGRVLIVTYTNSAVGNFRSRIGEFLEARGFSRHQGYEVRTIHSLALGIVRERPEDIGWSDSFTIADEASLSALLGGLTRAWISRNRSLWEEMLRSDLRGSFRSLAEKQWAEKTEGIMRNLIQAFKSRRLSPQTALGLTRHLPETSALRWAAEIFVEYQRELAIQGAVDFGDLMLGAHQLLSQDGELLARLQRRWTYICEDEAQDSYRLQEHVLRLLAGPAGNLVRVGDANQAIMGTFTAAEPELFRGFCREDGVDLRPLTMAGRSSQDIIDLANGLVAWSREAHPQVLCRDALEDQRIEPVPLEFGSPNPRPHGYKVLARTCDDYQAEMDDVARYAAGMLTRYPEKTVAILLPTNFMVKDMTERLQHNGVPVRPLGAGTVPERLQTVRDLMSVLAFLAVPHEPERLLAALGHLMGLKTPDDAPFAEFLRGARPEELFYPLDGSVPFGELYAACPQCRGDIALQDALERLAHWLPQAILPPDELVVLLAADLGLDHEELSVAHHLAVRMRQLLQENPAFGLHEAVHDLSGEEQALGRFSDTVYDRKGFKPEPGLVYNATCHSAKGLEWDTVFVASMTRTEYPAVLSDKVRSEHWFLPDSTINPEALALAELAAVLGEHPEVDPVTQAKLAILGERLRLLYVAITRAKENLMLSCHRRDRFGKPGHPALAYQRLQAFMEHH